MAEKARSIRVRLSEGEWQSVKDRAAALGCSASSYVRHAVAAYALASDEAGGLRAELADARAAREREVGKLRDALEDAPELEAELAGRIADLAERFQAVLAAPWWRRGAVAARLLGPGAR